TEEARRDTEKRKDKNSVFSVPSVVIFFSAAAMTLALLFSWSRGAWLSFGAGTAVLVFFWPRQRKYGLLVVGLLVAGLLVFWQLGLIPVSVSDRLVSFTQDLRLGDVRGADISDENYAVLERLAHWQA
ncbi:MAG: O-antigen ligase family protein, partial [Anaerolineales bacterium]|nr:O-antigen ligase family protein [Anaerolineales bacterium]